MMFVTVGTHEQPFNRLVEYMDKLVGNGKISEKVIIQTGYSTYEPKHCIWKKFFSYQEMENNIADARIVITHGGPSSFIMPLRINKTPIVVPRKKEFDEHVNNHQVEFSKAVEERMGTIIVIEDINNLEEVIDKYDKIVGGMKNGVSSNNAKFCDKFGKIVEEIMH